MLGKHRLLINGLLLKSQTMKHYDSGFCCVFVIAVGLATSRPVVWPILNKRSANCSHFRDAQ